MKYVKIIFYLYITSGVKTRCEAVIYVGILRVKVILSFFRPYLAAQHDMPP